MSLKLPDDFVKKYEHSWILSSVDGRDEATLELIEAIVRDCAKVCIEYSTDHGDGMFDRHSDECAKRILRRYGLLP